MTPLSSCSPSQQARFEKNQIYHSTTKQEAHTEILLARLKKALKGEIFVGNQLASHVGCKCLGGHGDRIELFNEKWEKRYLGSRWGERLESSEAKSPLEERVWTVSALHYLLYDYNKNIISFLRHTKAPVYFSSKSLAWLLAPVKLILGPQNQGFSCPSRGMVTLLYKHRKQHASIKNTHTLLMLLTREMTVE